MTGGRPSGHYKAMTGDAVISASVSPHRWHVTAAWAIALANEALR
jgi:hypothetical protein